MFYFAAVHALRCSFRLTAEVIMIVGFPRGRWNVYHTSWLLAGPVANVSRDWSQRPDSDWSQRPDSDWSSDSRRERMKPINEQNGGKYKTQPTATRKLSWVTSNFDIITSQEKQLMSTSPSLVDSCPPPTMKKQNFLFLSYAYTKYVCTYTHETGSLKTCLHSANQINLCARARCVRHLDTLHKNKTTAVYTYSSSSAGSRLSPEQALVLLLHVERGLHHALEEGDDEVVGVVEGLHALHRRLQPAGRANGGRRPRACER